MDYTTYVICAYLFALLILSSLFLLTFREFKKISNAKKSKK